MEDFAIDPGWRDQASRAAARSRAISPHALGFSIAAHLLVAVVAVGVLIHFGAARPSQPDFLVAQIVDQVPGTGGRPTRANPQAASRPVGAGAAARDMVRPEPVTRRLRKLGSWMRNRLEVAKIEAPRHERKLHDEELSLLNPKPRPIALRPGVAVASENPVAIGAAAGTRASLPSGPSGSGNGGGAGTGSDRDARVAYGSAPAPDYPFDARRMEEQGVVMLRVLVGADGATRQVEVAHSSGFRLLDDAALETVRERWRFVPATRAGAAIESWVTVPIRFALTEAEAGD